MLMLSGCATWKHPTKGESDFYHDKLSCERQAAQIYPTVIVNQLNPGYQSQGTTYCRRIRDDNDSRVICNTTPGVYLPPSYSQNDVNAARRDEATESCLKAGGWRLGY
jgi:hypothetical protein